jgi:hypothetical protein
MCPIMRNIQLVMRFLHNSVPERRKHLPEMSNYASRKIVNRFSTTTKKCVQAYQARHKFSKSAREATYISKQHKVATSHTNIHTRRRQVLF